MKTNKNDVKVGIVFVDHGSLFCESNDLLLEVAEVFRQQTDWEIVEPAHMELAEPSISEAFRRCVEQGAEIVVVFPYFLGPGRHVSEDIPRLAAEAAQACGGVEHRVAEPLGMHALLLQIVDERVRQCLQ